MARLKGLNNVLKNLDQKVRQIEQRSYTGLYNAAAVIRKSMDANEPKIPVDLGNLKASWQTTKLEDLTKGPGIRIGFTASYAFWVHEAVGHNFSRPGSGPKYFSSALERGREAVLKEIRDAVHFDGFGDDK